MNNQTPDLNNPFIRIDGADNNKVQPTTEAKMAAPPISFLGCLSAILLFLAIVFGIFSLGKFIKNKTDYSAQQHQASHQQIQQDKAPDNITDDISHIEGTKVKSEELRKQKLAEAQAEADAEKKAEEEKVKKTSAQENTKCLPNTCKSGQLGSISNEVKALENKLLLNPNLSTSELNSAKSTINSLKQDIKDLGLQKISFANLNLDNGNCLIKDKDKYLAYWSQELTNDLNMLSNDTSNMLSAKSRYTIKQSPKKSIVQNTNNYSSSRRSVTANRRKLHKKHSYNSSSRAKSIRKHVVAKKPVTVVKKRIVKTTTRSVVNSKEEVENKPSLDKLKNVESITSDTNSSINSTSTQTYTTNNSTEKFGLSATKAPTARDKTYCPAGFLSNFDGKCYPTSKFYYDCGKGYTLGEDNYCRKSK